MWQFTHSCSSQPSLFARIACGKPSGVEISKIGEGSEFTLGGKELQIDHPVKASEYLAGTCFANGAVLNAVESGSSSVLRSSATAVKQFTPLKPRNGLNFKGPSFVRSNAASSHPAAPKPSERISSADVIEVDADQARKDSFWTVNWFVVCPRTSIYPLTHRSGGSLNSESTKPGTAMPI